MPKAKFLHIVDAIADLEARGFTLDFILEGNHLLCAQQKFGLEFSEFEIQEIYYFPRDKETSYERIVYAIEGADYRVKGILLITGTHHFTVLPDMINRKLQERIFERNHIYENGFLRRSLVYDA